MASAFTQMMNAESIVLNVTAFNLPGTFHAIECCVAIEACLICESTPATNPFSHRSTMANTVVVPDILHDIYQHLDYFDRSTTLFNLLLVSRIFYTVLRPYLYQNLVVRNTNPRLIRLIDTLRGNRSLLGSVQSLAIRFDPRPKPRTLLQRVFPRPDHFSRFMRLIIDARPPGLHTLAFGPPQGAGVFYWTSLSQDVQDTLFQLRCCSPSSIRSLYLFRIILLDSRMIRGGDDCASLEELHAVGVYLDLTRATSKPPPLLKAIQTLSLHLTYYPRLPVSAESLFNLEVLHIDRPSGVFDDFEGHKHAMATVYNETLKELHLQVVPLYTPTQRPTQLNLRNHNKLEILTLSEELYLSSDPHPNVATYRLIKKIKTVMEGLRSIDLPPFLPLLHIRINVERTLIDSEYPIWEHIAVAEQHYRALDECMVETVREGGTHVRRVMLSFILPDLDPRRAADELSKLKSIFVGMAREMGKRFDVYLGSEWSYEP